MLTLNNVNVMCSLNMSFVCLTHAYVFFWTLFNISFPFILLLTHRVCPLCLGYPIERNAQAPWSSLSPLPIFPRCMPKPSPRREGPQHHLPSIHPARETQASGTIRWRYKHWHSVGLTLRLISEMKHATYRTPVCADTVVYIFLPSSLPKAWQVSKNFRRTNKDLLEIINLVIDLQT